MSFAWIANIIRNTSTLSIFMHSGGNSVSEVGWGGGEGGGQSFTNFRQDYIALLGLRLHTSLRKPL